MRQVIVKLYKYDELSDKAKEKARGWYRDCVSQDFGRFGELNEPIETAAKLLGFTFGTHEVSLMSGKTRTEPNIYWRLAYSQGDGASFDGTYQYVKGLRKGIRQEFGTDKKLHAIADGLAELQKRYNWKLWARIKTRQDYPYIDAVEMQDGKREVSGEDEQTLLELVRDFAKWIYEYVRAEYEYQTGDEALTDGIEANEYDFRESGERSDG